MKGATAKMQVFLAPTGSAIVVAPGTRLVSPERKTPFYVLEGRIVPPGCTYAFVEAAELAGWSLLWRRPVWWMWRLFARLSLQLRT